MDTGNNTVQIGGMDDRDTDDLVEGITGNPEEFMDYCHLRFESIEAKLDLIASGLERLGSRLVKDLEDIKEILVKACQHK